MSGRYAGRLVLLVSPPPLCGQILPCVTMWRRGDSAHGGMDPKRAFSVSARHTSLRHLRLFLLHHPPDTAPSRRNGCNGPPLARVFRGATCSDPPLRTLHNFPVRQPELSSPITLKNRTLWFGELKLHGNKVVVSGWTWTGPVQEEIPLSNVTEFHRWQTTTSDEKGISFVLRRETGSTV